MIKYETKLGQSRANTSKVRKRRLHTDVLYAQELGDKPECDGLIISTTGAIFTDRASFKQNLFPLIDRSINYAFVRATGMPC